MAQQTTSLNTLISDDLKIRIRLYQILYVLAVPLYFLSYFVSIQLGMNESLVLLAINTGTAGVSFLISRFRKLSYFQAVNLFTGVLTIHAATAIGRTHLNNYNQISMFGCLILLICGATFLASSRRVIFFTVIYASILTIGSYLHTSNIVLASFLIISSALLVPAMSLHHAIYERLAQKTRRLNNIFNNAAAGIIQVDHGGKILQTNLKFREMTEYKENDLVGVLLSQLCPEGEVDPLKTFLFNAGHEYAPQIESRLQTKFGKYIWIRLVASNQPGSGFADNLILLALDISAEKKMNELSSFQTQILKMFARKVPFKVVVAELAKFLSIHTGGLPVVISLLKGQALEIVGSFSVPDNLLATLDSRPLEEGCGNADHAIKSKALHVVSNIPGSPHWQTYRKGHPKSPLTSCWSLPFISDAGSVAGVIEIYKYTEGSPHSALVQSLEIFSSLTGMAVMVRNSDEMQRVYTANLTHTAKLASLGEMAAGIAHEINNPMTIILGRAEQIKGAIRQSHIDIAKIDSIADNIVKSVLRVAKIIKGLRSFAQFNAGVEFTTMKVVDLINETIDLCGQKFKSDGVKITVSVANECSEIHSRGPQISQVLLNLLNNAYDAIYDRTDKWIEVRAIDAAGIVQIIVTDSGLGIPEEVAEKLFQPFFSTKSVDKGTGLGLSIAHGIVADHKGRIYVDKNCKNTRFVIELPQVEFGVEKKSA